MILTRIKLINDLIFKNIRAEHNEGLLHGKMGIAIYLFHLSAQLKGQKYIELANELIDQIYDGIGMKTIPTDFENGLAGIAWGIEHLVKSGFLEADTDEILRDIDDKIFLYITTNQHIPIDLKNGLLGYGYYLLSRLKGKDLKHAKDHDFLLKRLLITVINSMYEMIEEKEEIFREPIHFDSTWNLPFILTFLSEVRALNIYTHKIDIMQKRLSLIARAVYPINFGNRLFLLLSMGKVNVISKIVAFQEHSFLLKDGLDEEKILKQFQDKNVLVDHGLAGIQLILGRCNSPDKKHEFRDLPLKIAKRISTSEFWESVEKKEKIHAGNLGLLSGLAGVGMALINDISTLQR